MLPTDIMDNMFRAHLVMVATLFRLETMLVLLVSRHHMFPETLTIWP